MNTKARLLFIAATAILLLGGVQLLSALPVIKVDSSVSIAPYSIPVPESGTVIVGMNKVQISTNFSGQLASVDQVVVQLISSGGFNSNDIQSIRVWYEDPGGNGLFDNGTYIDDQDALSGGPYTFSGGTATIALNTSVTEIGALSVARLFVGVELKSTAATSGVTIGVQVTSLRQTGKTALLVPPHDTQKPLDKYRVGLVATNIAPSSQDQGESAPVLKLVFDPDDPDNSAAIELESIKLHATGAPRSDSDLIPGGVVLYEDTNLNGNYDSGTDSQVTSATLGATTPAYATLTPATAVNVAPAGKTFFAIVNISLTATVGNKVQLQVDNPSTDITFSDAYADEEVGPYYASVPAGRAYVQKGYLLGTSAVPSPNTPLITITVQATPQQPVVTSIVPGNNATNVERTTTVVAMFSKPMKASTINTTNFTLTVGATPIPCTVTPTDAYTATLTPSSTLEWGTTYTATVHGDGSSGVQDSVDNLYLAANKVWSFSTSPAIYPAVLATSPLNAAIEVPRTTTVTATFSKDMVGASVQTSFKLHDGTSYVSGTVSYDAPSRTATFTPDTLPFPTWGTHYTASIDTGAVDTDGLPLQSTYTWTFTTTAPEYPLVTATYPANGEYGVSMTANLTATFSKDMNPASVIANFKLYDAALNPVAASVSWDGPSVTATLDPTPTLNWGETYTAKVLAAAASADGLTMLADKVWTFTTTMPIYPIVVSRTPVHGAIEVDIGSNFTATFSKDIDGSSIVDNTTCIVFHDNNGNNVYDSGDTLVSSDSTLTAPRIVTINPDANLLWNTVYTVNITTGVKDTDGLFMQNVSFWFFTTKVPVNPVVSNTVPAPDATGVLPDATVTATFSKDMKESETEAAFSLHTGGATGPVVTGTVHYDTGGSRTLTFTPGAALTPGQKYTAVVHGDNAPGSAQATDDLYQLVDKVWSFWVSTRPEVLLLSPADGSVGVSRGTTIKAVFSKDVDGTTVTATTFLVEDDAGTPVSGTVSYDNGTFTATFDPDADLLFASYNVTVKAGAAGVKDVNGIELAADVTWTFRTLPSLTEPVAANNKITPTSTEPVTVFIPQPTADPADRVTVQVFTATGKKVATLINNQPWNSFEASLPLLWDGKNDRGEKLGPGLYFIQIRATKYLRTLKVMIVR
ncbi:MAG: Ig-like domain-containing protein [Spirochaetes bacterium]|nr:Ig-like domain-containing protein [Spirochaetota bacterium]